jgi:hypothetical protein
MLEEDDDGFLSRGPSSKLIIGFISLNSFQHFQAFLLAGLICSKTSSSEKIFSLKSWRDLFASVPYIFVDTLCCCTLVFVHQSALYLRISTTAAMY